MSPKSHSQTLSNSLRVLEALGRARELGVSDLSRCLGLPKTVTHRLLATFEHHGYLRKNPLTRKYSLSSKLWELGCVAINRSDVHHASREVLDKLVADAGETAYVSRFQGLEVVYIAKVEGRDPLRVYVEVGGRTPAYCTASGKVHLAYADPRVVAELFRTPLPKLTRRTITHRSAFENELVHVRQTGISLNLGERREDIGAVSAPVFDHQGECVAALGISGPIGRFSTARLPSLIAWVRAAASELSSLIGYCDAAHAVTAESRPVSDEHRETAMAFERSAPAGSTSL